MRAHAHDLRAEVAADFGLTERDAADEFVHTLATDWRRAPLGEADAALCRYAETLTTEPRRVGLAEIDDLRRCGVDDPAIHDATQVISYFNYINRVAESLGVEAETFVRAWEQEDSSGREE